MRELRRSDLRSMSSCVWKCSYKGWSRLRTDSTSTTGGGQGNKSMPFLTSASSVAATRGMGKGLFFMKLGPYHKASNATECSRITRNARRHFRRELLLLFLRAEEGGNESLEIRGEKNGRRREKKRDLCNRRGLNVVRCRNRRERKSSDGRSHSSSCCVSGEPFDLLIVFPKSSICGSRA